MAGIQKGNPMTTDENGGNEPQFDDALIDDIATWIKKYVALPSDDHATMLAVWVIHTWTFEAAHTTPYLFISSAGPSSGKTRLMDTLGIIARNAIRAEDMTKAVMFKLIERECPTLMIDEVDTVWAGSQNNPMKQILNTGYKQGGCAWREQARELIKFSTFSPKVLAGICNGFMPETIASRCIPIEMEQRKAGQKLERFSERYIVGSDEVESLLDRIMAFRELCFADVTAQRPIPSAALKDRQNEIVEPLLAIAAVFGRELELRNIITGVFSAAGSEMSPKQQILQRIRDAFGDATRIFSRDLCAALGRGYEPMQLAEYLRQFGIQSKAMRISTQLAKGYEAADFMPVWSIYLDQPVLTAVEDEETTDEEEKETVTA